MYAVEHWVSALEVCTKNHETCTSVVRQYQLKTGLGVVFDGLTLYTSAAVMVMTRTVENQQIVPTNDSQPLDVVDTHPQATFNFIWRKLGMFMNSLNNTHAAKNQFVMIMRKWYHPP